MQKIIDFINSIEFNYLLVFYIAVFYSLERILNSPFKFTGRWSHFVNNVLFQVTFYVANLGFALAQVSIVKWTSAHQIGVFNQWHVPLLFKFIIGLMCIDFMSYWAHRLAHKIPILWRLHRVHHSDNTMDTSSFFRGHPLEILIFGTANTLACIIFGLDLPILASYFVLILPLVIAQHANISLPAWTDRIFGKIFITPNFHKVHHHEDQFYTDSNFADLFVFWDKLFNTYKKLPVKQIRFGLKEFDTNAKQSFWYLMKSPFLRINRVPTSILEENVELTKPLAAEN